MKDEITPKTEAIAAREAEIARLNQRIAKMTASGQVAMQQLAAREAEIAHLSQRIVEMTACGQVVMQQLAARKAEIIAVSRSTSWRITAPIRGAKRTARWLVIGMWSWITLKRGSRPRRVARILLKRISG